MFKQRKPRKPRCGLTPEEKLHLSVAAFLSVALRAPVWWSTIGHGSRIGIRERAMLKAKGLKPGIPDIVILMPQPIGVALGCIAIGIELKADHGRASDDQLAAHADLTVAGMRIGVCRSVDQVIELLERHGIPLHARVMGGGGIMKEAA